MKKYRCHIRTSAKKRNINLNISIEYAWELFKKQNGKCSLSGMDIYFSTNNQYGTASLDRIDSQKGYIEGNVQWIHKDINWMKNDFKQEDFIKYCKLIAVNN